MLGKACIDCCAGCIYSLIQGLLNVLSYACEMRALCQPRLTCDEIPSWPGSGESNATCTTFLPIQHSCRPHPSL